MKRFGILYSVKYLPGVEWSHTGRGGSGAFFPEIRYMQG